MRNILFLILFIAIPSLSFAQLNDDGKSSSIDLNELPQKSIYIQLSSKLYTNFSEGWFANANSLGIRWYIKNDGRFFIESSLGINVDLEGSGGTSFNANLSFGVPLYYSNKSISSILLDVPYVYLDYWGGDVSIRVLPGIHYEFRMSHFVAKVGVNLCYLKPNKEYYAAPMIGVAPMIGLGWLF